MAEYIDREVAYREICADETMSGYEKAYCSELIRNIPAADVAPVRHGRWEWFEEWNLSTSDHPTELENCGWRCSECKTPIEDTAGGYWDDSPTLKYCPECGANIDLEASTDEKDYVRVH